MIDTTGVVTEFTVPLELAGARVTRRHWAVMVADGLGLTEGSGSNPSPR